VFFALSFRTHELVRLEASLDCVLIQLVAGIFRALWIRQDDDTHSSYCRPCLTTHELLTWRIESERVCVFNKEFKCCRKCEKQVWPPATVSTPS
jgi:hypothetical protein